MSHFSSLRNTLQPALNSRWLTLLIFLGACLSVLAQAPIAGTVVFVLLICLLLVFSENTALTLLPFSLLCMFVLKEYDSFNRFIRLWWLVIPVVPSLLWHLIAYREKPHKGLLFYSLLGICAAVTLGGLGSISAAEYFTGANLYYVAGLGLGMVLMHLLVSAKYHDRENFDLLAHLSTVFYLIGIFAVFMLFEHYAVHWREILQAGALPDIQWSNNLSTFLMIALPFGFYFTKRHPLHMIPTLLMLCAMLLSGSRAPLIFGVLEYVLCVVVFCFLDRRHCYVYLFPLLALCALAVIYRQPLWEYASAFLKLDSLQLDPRYQMALRAWGELRGNPLFGSGLGATGRQDIYEPVKFAMNWYHCAPFQIIGSLGILGICAYGFLYFARLHIFFQHKGLFGWTLMLSQAGLFMMSLVNPGCFCPFPYEFFMVMLFAVLANQPKLRT